MFNMKQYQGPGTGGAYSNVNQHNLSAMTGASTAINAITSTASDVISSVRQKHQLSKEMQAQQLQNQANRQLQLNDQFYNSAYANSMRLKDVGFNPNSFVSAMQPQAASSGGAMELPSTNTQSMDSNSLASVGSDMTDNLTKMWQTQANINSREKIAHDAIENQERLKQLDVDTKLSMQKNDQQWRDDFAEKDRGFKSDMQQKQQNFEKSMIELKQKFDATQNEADRQLIRQQQQQDMQKFRESLEEQKRVNDANIMDINQKLIFARNENARKEAISYYEQQLKQAQAQSQVIQNQMAEFDNQMQGATWVIDNVAKFLPFANHGLQRTFDAQMQRERIDYDDYKHQNSRRRR